jgi:hypothetical protein
MQIKLQNKLVLAAAVALIGSLAALGAAQAADKPPKGALQLADAVMCEGVRDLAPVNQAVVFSIATGKVSCFTSFNPVPRQTFIYHRWFYRDELSTKKKLFLKPPSWSTYSSIQLREADKGPWRVEITDEKGRLFGTLRFSVTD